MDTNKLIKLWSNSASTAGTDWGTTLTLSGTATATAAAALTIGGSIIIGSGTTFNMSFFEEH